MDWKEFNTFLETAGVVLAGDAERFCQETGQRGMLIIYAQNGPFEAMYVPLADIEKVGYSAKVLDAVNNYRTTGEAILQVLSDKYHAILRVSVENDKLVINPIDLQCVSRDDNGQSPRERAQ